MLPANKIVPYTIFYIFTVDKRHRKYVRNKYKGRDRIVVDCGIGRNAGTNEYLLMVYLTETMHPSTHKTRTQHSTSNILIKINLIL